MSIKRFFFVAAPHGETVHMAAAPSGRKLPVEGDRLYCGRFLSTKWLWVKSRFDDRWGVKEVCAACLRNAPATINVARVK